MHVYSSFRISGFPGAEVERKMDRAWLISRTWLRRYRASFLRDTWQTSFFRMHAWGQVVAAAAITTFAFVPGVGSRKRFSGAAV
jgi:hypothetical protein